MDVRNRTEKLAEVRKNQNPEETRRLPYAGAENPFSIYNIPLDCLIFNQYNGRIATFVKTHETTHDEIDASDPEGDALIQKFLWESNKRRNEVTLRNIKENGQIEAGVVTLDGVVVDGNRRFMLLRKLAENGDVRHFRAIILDKPLTGNAKEILRLETICQTGYDEKVDYNPIEKYLKCQELKNHGYTEKQIASFMFGEKESDIKKYLRTLRLLEEFLEYIEAHGMYTLLGKEQVEGPFVDLDVALNRSKRARDWEAEEDDLEDFKLLMFDYIRAGFRTAHEIRNISGRRGVFNDKSAWQKMMDMHSEINEINDREKSVEEMRREHPNHSTEEIINERNRIWKEQAGGPEDKNSKLRHNLATAHSLLEHQENANKPDRLLKEALSALNHINTEWLSKDRSTMEICTEIGSKIEELIQIISKKD